MLPDDDTCYRALSGRDARFDGWFYTAVRTTGVYCRPSCPAVTPYRENVTFHPSAAAAQRAGYRACKRCRPDASPGSPEWDVRGDLVGRALRLIGDGVIDRDGVAGLAKRLGYSERQVTRTLLAEVGAGPLALARAQRAQTARILLETTDLPMSDVAYGAGFSSVRQFNDTIRAVFATTPTALRAHRRGHAAADPGTIVLRLPYRAPMDFTATLRFLGMRAIPGVEQADLDSYMRVVRAPGGPALVTLTAGEGALCCRVGLTDQRDLVLVVSRVRRLLDLDADPSGTDGVLGADPVLGPLVGKLPGLRAPGAVDGFEMAVRAVVGQQISVSGARTVLGRITAEHGEIAFQGKDFRLFPSADQFAEAAPESLPMPRARGRTLLAIAEACATGELTLDPGADRDRERAVLLGLPGIGPWTADYIQMRAMSDPDVLLATDLGVRKSAEHVNIDLAGGHPEWAPWRSYATHHLWAAGH
ncbi:MAG TPA: AlkA N-terminal domain-containing protein [Pseudonocardiaceae bacterium]|nr:AlkA N-terminal domain-containing protein [Pseudonocardiaceae bacterium]